MLYARSSSLCGTSRYTTVVVSRPSAIRPCRAAKKEETSDPLTYVQGAAESVVAHNFKGDKTEPPAWGGQGFSGDIHSRGRDGFHGVKAKPAGKPAAVVPKDGEAAPAAEAKAEGAEDTALTYLQEAAERVVGHNFTGDVGAVPPPRVETGFAGDIHTRKRDGFHTIKD